MNNSNLVIETLNALGLIKCVISGGSPTTETEFLSNIFAITGIDDSNTNITSNSPSDVKITWSEYQTKYKELEAEYDALQYQRDRQYPTWQEQMDMQYHDQLNGTTTWKDAVAKVKADNPKP